MIQGMWRQYFDVRICSVQQSDPGSMGYFALVNDSWPELLACNVHEWLPSLAPSRELRQRHRNERSDYAFACGYRRELSAHAKTCGRLVRRAKVMPVWLVHRESKTGFAETMVLTHHLETLEAQRRYDAGWIIGGYTYPKQTEICELGGLWLARHKVWTMPDRETWHSARALLS